MLARFYKALAAITTAVSTTQTGTAQTVKGSPHDDVNAANQGFVAVFELTAAGGTSPTLDAEVQTSWDGTTWHTVASMTQLTGAGTQKEIKTIATLGPQVRSVVTPGGTANPDVTGNVLLASSGFIA